MPRPRRRRPPLAASDAGCRTGPPRSSKPAARLIARTLAEFEPADIGRRGKDFLACYANYYVANGAVIMPRFGDRKADGAAAATLRDLYQGRKVVPLPVDNLGEGGGIHCSTQQLPRAR
ncbi:agmatine deiminase family protein [Streptomyces sp. 2224.1]|uniref:agmatine deiminase family protein n=1 Tax=Streptomyces sp. 2224.1 TaxID=1881020 RepID=UPI00210A98C9|nr:agmatine deiminase family protein [Streptomyces sp. 2224.1]